MTTDTTGPGEDIVRSEKDLCTLRKECWSEDCASFIHYNELEKEWQYKASDVVDLPKATVAKPLMNYLYAIIYECPEEFRRQVDTFHFYVTPPIETVKWALPALAAE
jgi:hypothetical protein